MEQEQTSFENHPRSLGRLWQFPALLAAIVLFASGLLVSVNQGESISASDRLDAAMKLVERGEFEHARQVLSKVGEGEDLSDHQLARKHALSADIDYAVQLREGWDVASNHQMILDNYTQAESLGMALSGQRVERVVSTLLALGKVGPALERLEVAAGEVQARVSLYQRAYRIAEGRPTVRREVLQRLIEQYEDSDDVAIQAWAIAELAEMRMVDESVPKVLESFLLPNMGKLVTKAHDAGLTPEEAGLLRLKVLRANAYFQMREIARAEQAYLELQSELDSTDALSGQVLLGLAKIRHEQGSLAEALDLYAEAVRQFPKHEQIIEMLSGRARCEIALGKFDKAVDTFGLALAKAGEHADDSAAMYLTQVIQGQAAWQLSQGSQENALDLMLLLREHYQQDIPEGVLEMLAQTHRRIGESLLGKSVDAPLIAADLDAIHAQQRGRANEHLHLAAQYYDQLAAKMIETDDLKYGDALWYAASCYENAGLFAEAIERFASFKRGRKADPRHLAATLRLANAYHAEGQFNVAIDLYRTLIQDHPKTRYAYQSYVPLALCYLAQGDENVETAERYLLKVVSDHPALRPKSSEYREALIELANLYYQRGKAQDMENAIVRYEQAIERYPEDPRIYLMHYRLSDAYRQSAKSLREQATAAVSPAQQSQYLTEAARRLRAAQQGFEKIVRAHQQRAFVPIRPTEDMLLRNAYFNVGDCAFELENYLGNDGAVALYRRAAEAYRDDPVALIALVQIVNSYCELEDFKRARAANEQALLLLRRLPAKAFEDPNLPMSRKHWERWLDWTGRLTLENSTAAVDG